MKKIVIIVLSFICVQIGYAQSLTESIDSLILKPFAVAERIQIKGQHNIYTVEKIGSSSSLFVWNINSVYVDVVPGYPDGFMDKIILVNKDKLNNYFRVHFFPNMKNKPLDKRICLRIYILSDMKGKIEEVYFSYDEDTNISIVDVESLENEIKNKFRLSYRSIDSSPIQANYLDYVYEICE
ncbi:hypothetical protein H8788_00225 [Parabacteroides faecis]|uniref:hypothetical protein n=1 Tax=Parabacteroides TaxID=375288 RepID=UPI0011C3A7A2|nr:MULTISPECIES: hypothetical protein [Parabacteroides]MBC8616158.1 hypothetical protein [Parabacteroides faecis]